MFFFPPVLVIPVLFPIFLLHAYFCLDDTPILLGSQEPFFLSVS